jgi:hypothetical protein
VFNAACPFPVHIGIAGTSANLAARAPSVPPNALIVLPLHEYDIDIGVDPSNLLTSTAYVFVMRFHAVQPAFIGKGV